MVMVIPQRGIRFLVNVCFLESFDSEGIKEEMIKENTTSFVSNRLDR